jgi:hypothetical protein
VHILLESQNICNLHDSGLTYQAPQDLHTRTHVKRYAEEYSTIDSDDKPNHHHNRRPGRGDDRRDDYSAAGGSKRHNNNKFVANASYDQRDLKSSRCDNCTRAKIASTSLPRSYSTRPASTTDGLLLLLKFKTMHEAYIAVTYYLALNNICWAVG